MTDMLSAAHSPALRRAAIAYLKALIAAYGITEADLAPAPRAARARPAVARKPGPRAPQPAPRPAAATRAPVPPAPRAAPAPAVETAATKRTVAPVQRFDPRYQCDPTQPVEGAGFSSDWQRRRTAAT